MFMPGITVRDGQPIDLILKLVKKQVEKAGTIGELRRRSFYEKPSVKSKKKSAMARKRLIKQMRKMGRM
jgi:small subunit ribosomal protein S21